MKNVVAVCLLSMGCPTPETDKDPPVEGTTPSIFDTDLPPAPTTQTPPTDPPLTHTGLDQGEIGDDCPPCSDGAIQCLGTDSGCALDLWCIGSPSSVQFGYSDTYTCTSSCDTDDDCPAGFSCATHIIDTIDIGEYCSG